MIVGVDEVDYMHFECPNTIEVRGKKWNKFLPCFSAYEDPAETLII